MLNTGNESKQKDLFNQMVSLATIKGKNAQNVSKSNHYTFVKSEANLTYKVVVTAGIVGIVGVLSNSINGTRKKLSSLISN